MILCVSRGLLKKAYKVSKKLPLTQIKSGNNLTRETDLPLLLKC